mmetsp:Transcript_12566/g.31312  ORF Transcript_12566/g.31312 Transcript_12566/m.31312 type:complete len:250 (-) Transcript_12566:199-948(-)
MTSALSTSARSACSGGRSTGTQLRASSTSRACSTSSGAMSSEGQPTHVTSKRWSTVSYADTLEERDDAITSCSCSRPSASRCRPKGSQRLQTTSRLRSLRLLTFACSFLRRVSFSSCRSSSLICASRCFSRLICASFLGFSVLPCVTLKGRFGTAATAGSSAAAAEDEAAPDHARESSGSPLPLLVNGGGIRLIPSAASKSLLRLVVSSTQSKEAGPLFLEPRESMIASLNVSVAGTGPSGAVGGGETP